MKKLFTLLLFALPIIAKAQITDPVTWNFSAKKINATTYEVQMKATIESSWHLYGQDAGEGPAEPTAFSFSNNPLLSINGKIAERGKLQKTFDKIVKAEVKYYEKEVTFVQTVKIKGKAATKLN